ncbi:MAG TPA: UrcA family protein [Steroidobacteraceae bacterium]|jgi:UrcA family protein
MNKFKVALMVAAGAMSIAATGLATAQSTDAPKLVVRYNAASLDTEAGVRHLYVRLERAAEQVCPNDTAGLFPSASVVECRKHAVEEAVAAIHNTRLAALSEELGKRI